MIEIDLVSKAALNNAQWCDFVCSSYGNTGLWTKSIWVNKEGNLPFYPNAVTLVGSEGILDQRQWLRDVISSSLLGQFVVKDSFHTLDLSDFGFNVLFEANWIFKLPSDRLEVDRHHWVNIKGERALGLWEMEWSKFNQVPYRSNNRFFRAELLLRPEIHILLAFQNGEPVGGGIISAGNGVVGISNLFYSPDRNIPIWNGLCYHANQFFPGFTNVSYVVDNALPFAIEVGFKPIGSLRVWKKP
ncbi:hypothetical protein [Dyadobacter sp. CY326]|uniref:hypothetical protein n=1 Tax=Dyadobacter sp. CY326 TaxID=2907300 RepID=UPI001F2F9A4B|nr:hypothetical protein [Dyadobacter sp. CY326]MCE7065741.1 hypothetical protein [Dyadobacter sp. CY326]